MKYKIFYITYHFFESRLHINDILEFQKTLLLKAFIVMGTSRDDFIVMGVFVTMMTGEFQSEINEI